MLDIGGGGDVAGVSMFNNLESFGRINLYSSFSGESLPES